MTSYLGLAFGLTFVIQATLTDDVVEGRVAEPFFRRCVVMFVGTRLAGTILAQLLLLPGAHLIVTIARLI